MLKLTLVCALVVLLVGCSSGDDPGQPDPASGPSGEIFLSVSLIGAPAGDYDITAVEAVLTLGSKGEPITVPLTIEGDLARATVTDLEPGRYQITTNILHGVPALTRANLSHKLVDGALDTLTVTELDWENLFPDLPRSILFVGNSLTYYNGGLGNHMAGFVAASGLGLDINASQIAPGGYTLEAHWGVATQDSVTTDIYDWVVLQGSPSNMLNDPSSFRSFSRLFINRINLRGGQSALFIPPSYEDYPQHAETLVDLCESQSNTLPVHLLPINQAWYHVSDDRPSLNLFHPDGVHPSNYGTYLYLCVIYAALFQSSPVGCDYVFDEAISPADRQYLQEAAWTVTSEYLGWGQKGD
jgi:hypothetical protein